MNFRNLAWLTGSAAALAGMVLPAAAADIYLDQYVAPYISTMTYVDLSATTTETSHLKYGTFTAGDHYRGVTPKFIDFKIYTDLSDGQRSKCLTVGTTAAVSGYSVDTEILAVNSADNNPSTMYKYTRLSDDINGSLNRYSKARFFLDNGIGDGGTVKIRIAVYNSDANLNKEHFYVYTTLVTGVTTEAGCFTDPEARNAYIDHVERVYIRP
jgi:hypothetical protein